MRSYFVVTVGLVVACSNEVAGSNVGTARVALDENAFCEKAITTCGTMTTTTLSECESAFSALRVSPECADALESATCSDFSGPSSVEAICFPSCSTPGTQSCNGDGTITGCRDSGTLVFDCNATCSVLGSTWSGICGKSAEGKTSDKDKCWCK